MTTIFWDIDNTLIDFVASSREAFFELCNNHHLKVKEAHFDRWYEFKEKFWRKQEQGLMTIDEIVAHQFDQLQEETGYSGNLLAFSLEFQDLLFHHAVPVEHAIETLQWCQEQGFRQFAASNGYIAQQTSRLSKAGMLHYFDDLFISDYLGVTKPNFLFFEKSLQRATVNADNVLMIGDNLITDVQGAQMAKIHTCWYNPELKENETDVHPDVEIKDISEVITFLKG